MNHGVHHITRACHTKAYVLSTTNDHIGSLNKILRSLLHSDTAKERHHFVLTCMIGTRNVLILLRQWVYSIVHCIALTRILMIVIDNCLTCQLRYTHDAISIVHTILLNRINRRVHFTSRTVKVGCVNMDAQGLTTNLLGMYACWISQPVVCMNDIIVKCTSYDTCNNRVIINLLMQIPRIATSKLHSAKIIDMHVIEISIQMVTQTEIEIRIHDVANTFANIISRYVAICNRHSIHCHDMGGLTLLITKRMR